MRFLAFDCLVIDDQNVMQRTLDKRYGVCVPTFISKPITIRIDFFSSTQRLKLWFYKPYEKMIRDHPHVAENQPFGLVLQDLCCCLSVYA
jgi:mRNA guanylyltransferase